MEKAVKCVSSSLFFLGHGDRFVKIKFVFIQLFKCFQSNLKTFDRRFLLLICLFFRLELLCCVNSKKHDNFLVT